MRKILIIILIAIAATAQGQLKEQEPKGEIHHLVDFHTEYIVYDSLTKVWCKNYLIPANVNHYYPFYIQIKDTSGNVVSEAYYDMVGKNGVLKGDVQSILFCLAEIISNYAGAGKQNGFIGQTDFKNKNSKHEKNIDSSTGSN